MKKTALLFIMIMAFICMGCLGIETETNFNRDGSGTMTLTYRISSTLMDMGGEESGVELPFDKETLEDSLEDADGVTLKSVESWSDDSDTYLKATLEFDDVSTFYNLDEYDDMGAVLTKDGGDFLYRQLIAPGSGEMTEEDLGMMDMMAPYYEGYSVTHIIHTPSRIKSNNLGELSDGGKTLTFTMPMMDVQTTQDETYLEIRW